MRNIHRPFHLELEKEMYFLTARCYENKNYLLGKQEIVLEILGNLAKELDIALYAWVVLSSHYHLLFEFRGDADVFDTLTGVIPNQFSSSLERSDSRKAVKKHDLSHFVNRFNSSIARRINQLDNTPGRMVFYQYWDWCIRNEIDFYKHFNYIHINPIKHKIVKNFNELAKYKYCSYRKWLDKKGENFLFDCFYYYSASDFEVDGD